jgi:hypothetical protein
VDPISLLCLFKYAFVCLSLLTRTCHCIFTFLGHIMYPELIMFEVHYGGRFNREHRVNYVGGDVVHYPDPYDRDEVSFIEVERVAKTYGYVFGDLIYYNIPTKSLDEGLWLLSFDHDVLQMLEHYIGHGIVELYLVAFVAVDVHVDLEGEEDSVDEEGEEEYEQ